MSEQTYTVIGAIPRIEDYISSPDDLSPCICEAKRASPRPDEDAETVLCGLRERYAPTVQMMTERAALLKSLTDILLEIADFVRIYDKYKGKEDAE